MLDKRRRILVKKEFVDIIDLLDGKTIDDVLMSFQKMSAHYEKDIMLHDYDVRFSAEYYGYDGGIELNIETYRYETDKEYQSRLEAENAKREKAKQAFEKRKANALAKALETEAEERALYEKLKSKFESA